MMAQARLAEVSGRRIVVAGASGFIGRRFIELAALQPEARVAGLCRSARSAAMLSAAGAEALRVGAHDADALARAFDGADAFVNLAYDFTATAAENVALFTRYIDAAQKAGVRRVVHLSSIVVYAGWPHEDLTEASAPARATHPYKRAKLAMEAHAESRRDRIGIAVLQPTCVYGPGSAFWTDAPAMRLAAGRVALPQYGRGAFNGIYVDDVAEAIAAAIVRPEAAGERFIINGADEPTWADLFSGYAAAIGRTGPDLEEGAAPPPANNDEATDDASPGLARKAVSAFTGLAGRGAVSALKWRMLRIRGALRPAVWRPAPHELSLYCSQARPSSEKAAASMQWRARTTFEEGVRATAPYLRRRFGGS